jgi:sulfide:quinone oxidoreductase
MVKLQGVRHRRKVVIAGGGVAGVEALLALRALLGGTVEIELLAPEPEFTYRPIAVAEAFGFGEVRRVGLAEIAADQAAHLRLGNLAAVDAAARAARTDAGETLAYDDLIVAVGARCWPAVDGAVTFGGRADRDALAEVISGIEAGAVRRLIFAAPPGVAWLLPLYELALFTAAWSREQELALEIKVLTYEAAPLEAFGAKASGRLSELLADSGVVLRTQRIARYFDGERLAVRGAHPLRADAVVALPGLDGPRLHGLPQDEHGFIPVDAHSAVRGVRHVYAAGDSTAFPIKQGGVAAQQADAAASSIAAGLGAVPRPEPFQPVLRGLLLTGEEPCYLRASGGGSEFSFQPLWWPPSKIAGRYLAPYLEARGHPALRLDVSAAELADRGWKDETSQAEALAEEHEAISLLLELADASAKRGSYDFAVKCLDAAADVGGPLPAERQHDRHAWAGRARR